MALVMTGPAPAATAEDRQAQFRAAAAEFGVPESILLGVSYLESRWDSNAGTPSTAAGYGPMHLTDAAFVASLPVLPRQIESGDGRGDDSRAELPAAAPVEDVPPASLQSIDLASSLTGTPKEILRTDAAANIRGGAALLAHYQAEIGAPLGVTSDPAAWYGAVAKYSASDTADAAQAFADEVYATLRDGAARVTDDGFQVQVAGLGQLAPNRAWLDRLGLRRLPPRPDGLECPLDLSCEWKPAAYQQTGDPADKGDYGQYDKGNRPVQQKIEYIVIHDSEGSFDGTVRGGQTATWGASWHYTMRSVDGFTVQHIKVKDVGWHAGNWYVNAKSVGIEHEGYAAQGTWYTEAMYRSSAKLVRYLATGLGVPLDRQHIIGHDNVAGIRPPNVAGMHWDPGPYWDWSHYFDLLHAPFRGTASYHTGIVTINPDFNANRPAFTNCPPQSNPGGPAVPGPCPSRGSSAVILRRQPAFDAPLVNDLGLRPDGSPNTMRISDHGARASAGQQYAIAEVRGDWTAIWYLGQKAWFYNPAAHPSALWGFGLVVQPKAGKATIPVYGRAYPEEAAYAGTGVPYQTIVPLQYTFPAGQRYVAGALLRGEYYRAVTIDWSSPGDGTLIRGENVYVQIQFGHRIMYVNLSDVDLLPSIV
jgi:hypothetical protein